MITPVDIENKKFKKAKFGGGYDIDDVEEFLESLILDYENIFKENTELKDKMANMQDSISYYKSIEEGINQTIENAQLNADSIRERALREAETIKEEAEFNARKELEKLNDEIRKKEYEYEEKKKQMQIYKIKVQSMLDAQLKILSED